MTRAIFTILVLMFVLAIVLLVGTVTIEPVGEFVLDRSSISVIGGEDIIKTVYDVALKWMILLFLAGFGYWAVAWYLRRERVPRGGRRR